MLQNYFVVNEEKYYTGTIIVIKYHGKKLEASFVCYDTQHSQYVCRISEHINLRVGIERFKQMLIEVTDKKDNTVRIPTIKVKKDMQINNLFCGWVWYIFLMLLSVIFKNTIMFWILISIVFFRFRSKKIKKEGTYIEW
jgi:hypothetical protein